MRDDRVNKLLRPSQLTRRRRQAPQACCFHRGRRHSRVVTRMKRKHQPVKGTRVTEAETGLSGESALAELTAARHHGSQLTTLRQHGCQHTRDTLLRCGGEGKVGLRKCTRMLSSVCHQSSAIHRRATPTRHDDSTTALDDRKSNFLALIPEVTNRLCMPLCPLSHTSTLCAVVEQKVKS